MSHLPQNSTEQLVLDPVRYIGRMPVYIDEFGEFAYSTCKIWHAKDRIHTDLKVKVDANIDAIRNVHSLELRRSAEIGRGKKSVISPNASEGMLGYIVHRNGGHPAVAGDTSLTVNLFGNSYLRAQHRRPDKTDFRQGAFKQVEPA